jgi:putative ABC transport system ATP-binding protein
LPGSVATCVGLVKIYWTPTGEVNALKGIDVTFPAGAVSAVVGPSGSGKSSLLRILAAMDLATAGRVTVGGVELAGLSLPRLRRVRRRLLGYVFQRPADNLISYMDVTEQLMLAARLRGMPRRRAVSDMKELLGTLGIGDRRHHLPRQLSGGEQQRLAFARAVIGDPPLVVADEPTAELDASSGQALLATVEALAARGTAFVVATHDQAVVEMADRALYLRYGAMEAETTKPETEASERDRLSVIDDAGRVQLPPDALKLFPGRMLAAASGPAPTAGRARGHSLGRDRGGSLASCPRTSASSPS